jgi:hypothetical protein
MPLKKNPGCLPSLFGKRRSLKANRKAASEMSDDKEITYPYSVSNRFLTKAEHSFYKVAQKVLGEDFMLCPQVSLSSIFFITDQQQFASAFNRIARKRVDFIVCDAVTMKILFGIELDDSSHQREDRMERDGFVNRVFQAACLPLVHVKVRESYMTSELEVLFEDALGLGTKEPARQTEEETSFLPEVGVRSVQTEPAPEVKHDFCPNCGAPFKVQKSIAGPNVGHEFYVCSRYPECKTTIKIE